MVKLQDFFSNGDNNQAKVKLKMTIGNRTFDHSTDLTYLGVKLNRSLTFRHHLERQSKKITSRIALIWRLAVRLGKQARMSYVPRPWIWSMPQQNIAQLSGVVVVTPP